VDSAGNVYVSGWNGSASFIREFSSTATGACCTAIRTMWASHGSTFGGLAVDDRGNIFAMQDMTICKFGLRQHGDSDPVHQPAGKVHVVYQRDLLPTFCGVTASEISSSRSR
jgi:hypothetical protein